MENRLFDVRVKEIRDIPSPEELKRLTPLNEKGSETVLKAREEISRVIQGKDDRLLLVFGPCSIHDPYEYIRFADRVNEEIIKQVSDVFVPVIRGPVEKPRTGGSDAWRGYAKDPYLRGTCEIPTGLYLTRDLFRNVANLGIPMASEPIEIEFIDYFDDLLSLYWIGARSVSADVYKLNASALSAPVGFKNTESGDVDVAIGAMDTAHGSNTFPGQKQNGMPAQITSTGNPDIFLIHRGSANSPNYFTENLVSSSGKLKAKGLCERVLVDCNHANSGKNPNKQLEIFEYLVGNANKKGEYENGAPLLGVMMEVYHKSGNQKMIYGKTPIPELSITDACSSFEETRERILSAAEGMRRKEETCA